MAEVSEILNRQELVHAADAAERVVSSIAAVRRFWQATCDAHPDRKGSWEDHRSLYDLAEALSSAESVAYALRQAARAAGVE